MCISLCDNKWLDLANKNFVFFVISLNNKVWETILIQLSSIYEGIRNNRGISFKFIHFSKFEHRPTKRKCFHVLWVYSNVISVVEFQRFVAKNQQTQRKSLYIVNTMNDPSSKKWHHLNFKVNFVCSEKSELYSS